MLILLFILAMAGLAASSMLHLSAFFDLELGSYVGWLVLGALMIWAAALVVYRRRTGSTDQALMMQAIEGAPVWTLVMLVVIALYAALYIGYLLFAGWDSRPMSQTLALVCMQLYMFGATVFIAALRSNVNGSQLTSAST